MTYVSVFGLGVLVGFAVPHVWNFLTWHHSKRRKHFEQGGV